VRLARVQVVCTRSRAAGVLLVQMVHAPLVSLDLARSQRA